MTIDGTQVLAEVSGLSQADVKSIWQDVRRNHALLDGCARHRFAGAQIRTLGEKFRCEACGGQMSLGDIGNYIRGYVAAGKAAADIWPGWK